MTQKYPKFLLGGKPKKKSDDLYVIHTQNPRFISKLTFGSKRNIIGIVFLDVWDRTEHIEKVRRMYEPILKDWFEESGRSLSNHEDDKLITSLLGLSFITFKDSAYSIDEIRHVIRAVFPIKSGKINLMTSSYQVKHLFEGIARYFGDNRKKYCSNEILIKAFKLEGFEIRQSADNPNANFNLRKQDVDRIVKLFN